MTSKRLEQIQALQQEIALLEQEAKEQMMADTVSGSSAEYPYCQHPIGIHGLDNDGRALKHLALAKAELSELQRFIDNIEDANLRLAFRYRYEVGVPTWNGVADLLGGGNTENSVKKAVSRYLQKSENNFESCHASHTSHKILC